MRIAALIALGMSLGCSSLAQAYCAPVRYGFLYNNEEVPVVFQAAPGDVCDSRFNMGNATVDKVTASKPRTGQLSTSQMGFQYKAPAGFAGGERFDVKVCGTNRAGQGCSTLNVRVDLR